MSFHNETIIKKSRKPHKCDACDSTIDIGEQYHRHAGVFYGDFYAYKLCEQCDIVIKKEVASDREYYQDGIDIQQLYWDINPNPEYLPYFEKIKNKSKSIKKLIDRWKSEPHLYKQI